MTISGVILAKNEESHIEKCIKSLDFCDEVIVIDDNSTDKTLEKAKGSGAVIFSHSLNNDFSAQRNYGLEKAKGDWVIFIDADEVVSDDLKKEIKETVNVNTDYSGYYIKREDCLWEKKLKHGETGKTILLRLAKKGLGNWRRIVHEKWDVSGKVGKLKNPILHYPHQNLEDFITHIEEFSTLHATANYSEGKKTSLSKIFFYPLLKFIKNYLFLFGFSDGVCGMVHALLMSFHSYLSWSKLWLIQKQLMSKKY